MPTDLLANISNLQTDHEPQWRLPGWANTTSMLPTDALPCSWSAAAPPANWAGSSHPENWTGRRPAESAGSGPDHRTCLAKLCWKLGDTIHEFFFLSRKWLRCPLPMRGFQTKRLWLENNRKDSKYESPIIIISRRPGSLSNKCRGIQQVGVTFVRINWRGFLFYFNHVEVYELDH